MEREWRAVIAWGIFAFIVSSTIPFWYTGSVPRFWIMIPLAIGILSGTFRYFFIPVTCRDVLEGLSSHIWRTGSEIEREILIARGVPPHGLRGVMGVTYSHLASLVRQGYVVRRLRRDPSGLTSTFPQTEYRLTENGEYYLIQRGGSPFRSTLSS